MSGVVAAARRRVSFVRGIHPFVVLQRVWNASAAFLRCLSWRRRRLMAARKRLAACLLLACGLVGTVWAEPAALWVRASTLAGNGRLRGQILVRPPIGSGAVRSAAVRLVPVVPTGSLTGVLFALGASAPEVVTPAVDHAGRWSSRFPVPGWGYAVVVDAERCVPRVAGVVETFWFRSVRADYVMASCWSGGLPSQWIVGRSRSSPRAWDSFFLT